MIASGLEVLRGELDSSGFNVTVFPACALSGGRFFKYKILYFLKLVVATLFLLLAF